MPASRELHRRLKAGTRKGKKPVVLGELHSVATKRPFLLHALHVFVVFVIELLQLTLSREIGRRGFRRMHRLIPPIRRNRSYAGGALASRAPGDRRFKSCPGFLTCD